MANEKQYSPRSLVRETTAAIEGEVTPSWYTDYATGIANKFGLYVYVKGIHIPDSKVGPGQTNLVKFRAFLNSFSENYTTKLKSEELVGHYEPLRKVTGVERTVQVGLEIPSFSLEDSMQNLQEVKSFVQLLYPRTSTRKAGSIHQKHVISGGDPLFRVKFANLIVDSEAVMEEGASVNSHPITTLGQKGYIDNLSYQFDPTPGFYVLPNGFTYPKLITLSFNFYPLHEVSPSWTNNGFDHKNIPAAVQPDLQGQLATHSGPLGTPVSVDSAGASGLEDTPAPIIGSQGETLLGQNIIE